MARSPAARGRGRSLTPAERLRVEGALRRNPEWSDRSLAAVPARPTRRCVASGRMLEADDEIEEYISRGPQRRLSLRAVDASDVLREHCVHGRKDYGGGGSCPCGGRGIRLLIRQAGGAVRVKRGKCLSRVEGTRNAAQLPWGQSALGHPAGRHANTSRSWLAPGWWIVTAEWLVRMRWLGLA